MRLKPDLNEAAPTAIAAAQQRLRVLMLSAQLGYGGSEASFLAVSNFLARDCDVTVVVLSRAYAKGGYASAHHEIDLNLIVLDEESRSRNRVIRWFTRIQKIRQLKRNADVTVSFLSGPNLLNILSGANHTIVSERGSKIHHVGMSTWQRFLWTRILDPFIYRLADRIVPASVDYAAEVARIAGRGSAKKIVPIEGAIDVATLLNASDAEPDADLVHLAQYPTIMCCGRLDRGKGLEFLIEVFADLKNEVREAKLLLIGDGPSASALADLASRLGLIVSKPDARLSTADVVFAGYRPTPIRHFRFARVFAFTSEHEGLPKALMEAVASGAHVLAADCPYGARSLLSNGALTGYTESTFQLPAVLTNGVLMPAIRKPGSDQIWRAELVRALRNGTRRASYEARHRSIQRFGLEIAGQKWLDLVWEVAQRNSRPSARVRSSAQLKA
jgi:glycosyltransferase involved in cell wall biosynthesis